MGYRYNVSCSKVLSKHWTPTAIECYNLRCECSRCNLYKIYFEKSKSECMMKQTVIELVRNIGIPEETEL